MTTTADDWDRHWADYQEAAGLNPAQEMRRRLILRELRLLGARRLLDVGSGSGDLAREVKARRPEVEVLGLEGSSAGVAFARQRVPQATFVRCDLRVPAPPEPQHRAWAPFAVCSEVLEHLDDPQALLVNVKPYLAAGADLLVTVPGGPMSAFDRHIGHRRHFTRRTLRELLEAAGYEVRTVRGAGFPFFNLYRLAVIARGTRLVTEATAASRSWPAVAAMRVFGLLFRLNLDGTLLGWQLVARARAR